MKKIPFLIFLFLVPGFLIAMSPFLAQSDPKLTLSLKRNFGYSSGTGKIQGTFTLKVDGPENIEHVVFQIDGEEIGAKDVRPFELRFRTDDYTLGIHTFTAIGFSVDGSEFHSNQIRVEFVSAKEGWNSVLNILVPLLAIIFGGLLLSYIIPNMIGRRSKSEILLGTPNSYGLWGGAICPKCDRPFSRHFWGLNLGAGKYDRCPHCGKWSLVRRAFPEELKAAELAELQMKSNQALPPASVEEKLRSDLDDTRYHDL